MKNKPVHRIMKSQSGFTIIEVLIAIAIFSVGFMAVGVLQTRALNSVSFSQDNTIAIQALDAQVEVLKRTPFYMDDIWHNNLVDDDGDGNAVFDLSPQFRDSGQNPDYSIINGEYRVSWWIDTPHTIPNRWTGGNLVISKNITVTVARTGDNPATNALNRIEFVKYWVTDN
jgi:prepilin-type N-terminal cleavage/methylation domain-containing protein